MNEFGIINSFFKKNYELTNHKFLSKKNFVGIGDDAAVLGLKENIPLVVSSDMLVEKTHFSPQTDAFSVGYKTLAVNLSDLAAMGAEPVCFTLSANIPKIDLIWLKDFSDGLFFLSSKYSCPLIGGDTVSSFNNPNKVFSVTIIGCISSGNSLRRELAVVDDDVWLSGDLGEPATALKYNKKSIKLFRPNPRVELGKKLIGIANSAIDISDGLSSELGHIAKASAIKQNKKICIEVYFDYLKNCLSSFMKKIYKNEKDILKLCKIAASSGDEYELCFTAAVTERKRIVSIGKELGLNLTRIGKVVLEDEKYKFRNLNNSNGVVWLKNDQCVLEKCYLPNYGYSHF